MKKLLVFLAIAVFLALPMSASATVKIGKDCTEESTGTNEKTITCKVYLTTTNSESIDSLDVKITPADTSVVTIGSVTALGGFTYAGVEDGVYSFLASTAQTGTTIEVFQVKFVATFTSAKDNCDITIEGVSIGNSTTVTVKSKDETTTNSENGAFLPIAIFGVGIVAVVGVYMLTNKKTKMYKI